jgi:hypothetical protein
MLLFEQAALRAGPPVTEDHLAGALTDLIHRAIFWPPVADAPAAAPTDHPAERSA